MWVKRGLIFSPQEHPELARSHAQVPTVRVLADRFRIYFADRNDRGKSFVTWIEVDRENPHRILGGNGRPVLSYGPAGSFDDEGQMPGDFVERDGALFMYYTGWNQGVTVPYRNSIGLAVSADGGNSFRRAFEGPVLDRTPYEPLMAVTPFLLPEDDTLRMWYVSGTQWTAVAGKLEPVYVVRYAQSNDGVAWKRPNEPCIEQRDPFEAQAHPSVLRTSGGYQMWFCYRDSRDFRDGAGSYRIGYAESNDARTWRRDDSSGGLSVSADGWDSTMICYPYVLRCDGKTYMFYNGNGFGRSGIGYAVMEE